MLGNLLEKKLREQKDNIVIAVMTDDMAFMGKLVEFDKDTLVFQNVSQASSKDIDWEEMDVSKSSGEAKTCTVPGCIEWTDVDLEEVYLQVEHISRVWPRNLPIKDNKSSTGRDTIYRRESKAGENRAMGLDVPGEMK